MSRGDVRTVAGVLQNLGQIVLRGEQVLRIGPFSRVSVRFGGIYGPGRIRAIRQVRDTKAKLQLNETSYTNRIHRDDCAGAIEHLLFLSQPAPIYVAVDDEPSDKRDVQRWVAEELGMQLEEEVGGQIKVTGKRCRNALLKESGYSFLFPTFREGFRPLLWRSGRNRFLACAGDISNSITTGTEISIDLDRSRCAAWRYDLGVSENIARKGFPAIP